MSKITTKKRLVESQTRRDIQENKLDTIISKIFPEAYSGYPVSGLFYNGGDINTNL